MKLFNLIKENLKNKQQGEVVRWKKWDKLKQKIMDENMIDEDDLDEDPIIRR